MYTVTTKRDYMGRLVAMKFRRVTNTWERPDPYMFVDHAGNIHDNVGPGLPVPQYKNSPFQIILRFSTNEDGSNPVIRCISIDNEAHVLSHDDSDYYECDDLTEWQCLVYTNERHPFTNVVGTGILPMGTIPSWCWRPIRSNFVRNFEAHQFGRNAPLMVHQREFCARCVDWYNDSSVDTSDPGSNPDSLGPREVHPGPREVHPDSIRETDIVINEPPQGI